MTRVRCLQDLLGAFVWKRLMNFSSSPEFWVKIWLLISIPKFYRSLLSKSLGSNVMSMQEMGHIVTLDLTGLKCPLPVLKARRQLGLMRSGAELVVLADDPAAPLDFEHFCRTNGHKLIESKTCDNIFTIRISVSGSR